MDLPKSFTDKVDESIGELETVIGTLDRLAAKDGNVSSDEASLLSTIRSNLAKYCEFLEGAIEDGKITETEYTQMKSFETKILEDAEKQAKLDNELTAEEKDILTLLKKEISEISTLKVE